MTVNNNIHPKVIEVLAEVVRAMENDTSFDGITSVVVIVSKPSSEEKNTGYITAFSNVDPNEVVAMCGVILKTVTDKLATCDCDGCTAARAAGHIPSVH